MPNRGRLVLLVLFLVLACGEPRPAAEAGSEEEALAEARGRMVDTVRAGGVRSPVVLEAMGKVPRHLFVPERVRAMAYADTALPLDQGQTISQPLVVGIMTELAEVEPGDRVLEVGTGSGYQAAVLAECGAEVYSIEIVPELGLQARQLLEELGYSRVHVRVGDGYRGWPEHAPFQAIVITAAPPQVPRPLLEQLAVGGRLVVPEGERVQTLTVYRRTEEGYEASHHGEVRFVPMTGEVQGDD